MLAGSGKVARYITTLVGMADITITMYIAQCDLGNDHPAYQADCLCHWAVSKRERVTTCDLHTTSSFCRINIIIAADQATKLKIVQTCKVLEVSVDDSLESGSVIGR